MSQDHFVNMDAIFLQGLTVKLLEVQAQAEVAVDADDMDISLMLDGKLVPRLLQIARNLQSMDDRQGTEYSRGWNDHKNSHLARSNIVKSTSVPVFPDLEEALKGFKGEVQKLPPEGPKTAMKDTLTVDDLDL